MKEQATSRKEKKKEENVPTMIFAMMKEQHQEQLNDVQERNAEAMKTENTAMAEHSRERNTYSKG